MTEEKKGKERNRERRGKKRKEKQRRYQIGASAAATAATDRRIAQEAQALDQVWYLCDSPRSKVKKKKEEEKE